MNGNLALLLLLPMMQMFEGVELLKATCDSPQYLEFGRSGTVSCQFNNFFALLWYNATDFENGTPTLQYENFGKTGPGYASGDFDVHPNGSLIITEVQMRHDGIFTVAHTQSKKDFYEFNNVRVIVLVKPAIPFPTIARCGKGSNRCYTESFDTTAQCSVSGSKPSISLEFLTRTVEGDRNVSNDLVIVSEGSSYTSNVTTNDVFYYSSLLTLIVCKATSIPRMLEHNESSILVLNGGMDFSKVKSKSTYVKKDTRLELNCTDDEVGFLVWKKALSHTFLKQYLVLYSVFMGEWYTEIQVDDVTLQNNNSLVIPYADVKHEGIYICIFGDGLKDGWTVYNVTVNVPAYPLVEGCNQQQHCVLGAEYEGNLTCTVKGIRPQVQLRWKTFSDDDKALISFRNHHLTVEETDGTFDVTLVSQYRIRDQSRDKLSVGCEVVASEQNLMGLQMRLDLHFVQGHQLPNDPATNRLPWVIPSVITACAFTLVCGVTIKRFLNKRKMFNLKFEDKEEMTALYNRKHTDKELKKEFLKQLREKYKDLYDAVQPIPYIKDRLYCVDRVFVESGLEYLQARGGAKGQWVSLDTYKNIFNDPKVKSTRRILEGEPGYGKSTVTLQFAYDWCNPVSTMVLKDVDILIVLRLRQLGGVTSIYRAIKQFLLPKDSRLSESDLQNILQDSNSVVIILDGFDEYPDQDSISDVNSVIARQMFQETEVVLTTRSSFLPTKYPPLTKRLRLTGFDENARRYYIRKAVVGDDDDDAVRKIEGYLEDNPILSDLCQVPLLFVIFAHMTYENEQFRKLTSVTSFFRYMISCFHNHMRNKMKDENVRKYELFETDHRDLDKLAFEAFSGESQKIVWGKNEMCQLVGHEFYDQYIRIGILVEEEGLDINDCPDTPITEHVKYKTEVRFYHKLFCEWYAAHYLANYVEKNPNVDIRKYLQHLDPFDVQYLYRFSCGLNAKSSEKIIDYLKNIEGGEKFSILCILEQTGNIDNIKETICQLCSEGVIISGHDSLLLQRSSVQLLEIAARNDVPIKFVSLYNCLQSVDISTAAIKTISGMSLSSRIPVEELEVSLLNREMSMDENFAILQLSSMCPSLRKLW